MISVLKDPKNALIKQYQKIFEMEKVKLKFTEDTLAAIAKKAIAQGTGARGLRAILEDAMLDIMYDLPSQSSTVKECVITKDVIKGKGTPILLYEKAS